MAVDLERGHCPARRNPDIREPAGDGGANDAFEPVRWSTFLGAPGMPQRYDFGANSIDMSSSPDVDAVIVGAGFSGLYMLSPRSVTSSASSARVYEAGDGVGGTWYWNRYPGARCDSESYHLLVLVLRGARAGVGVEQQVPRAAGDPALPRTRRRPVRPAPRHPAEHPSDVAASSRGRRPLGGPHRPGRRRDGRFLITRSAACRRPTSPTSGARVVRGLPGTTPAPGPTTASTSPASGSA